MRAGSLGRWTSCKATGCIPVNRVALSRWPNSSGSSKPPVAAGRGPAILQRSERSLCADSGRSKWTRSGSLAPLYTRAMVISGDRNPGASGQTDVDPVSQRGSLVPRGRRSAWSHLQGCAHAVKRWHSARHGSEQRTIEHPSLVGSRGGGGKRDYPRPNVGQSRGPFPFIQHPLSTLRGILATLCSAVAATRHKTVRRGICHPQKWRISLRTYSRQYQESCFVEGTRIGSSFGTSSHPKQARKGPNPSKIAR